MIALLDYADWIAATDEHAAGRIEALRQTQRALEGHASAGDRLELARRLERWRYQLLNRREPEGKNQELADALDLAANQLLGGPPRSPRSPRQAIDPASAARGSLEEALAWFDPSRPLDDLEAQARRLTRRHFTLATGRRRMLLYAPLYLSNHCINHCLYCGFRYPNQIVRRRLEIDEAVREADALLDRGCRHVLLVAGEFPGLATVDYFVEILRAIRARGAIPSIEIAPQSTIDYRQMVEAGAAAVTLYQETYDPALYAGYHPRGTKASFDWRLEGHERAAEAGVPRLGFGVLLGLADPRQDAAAMLRHAAYIDRHFPGRTLAFSLPRIHEAPEGFRVPVAVDDETFVRLYCCLRIAFPQAELVLSTREPPPLRDRLAEICITQMSAGSCTAPGGYLAADAEQAAGEQFPVCDRRSPADVQTALEQLDIAPIWDLPPSPS